MTTATLPLFTDPAPTIPPRPGRHDPAVLDAAAERLWHDVRRWLVACGENDAAVLSARRQDVRECIGSSNGYQFARSLDDRGWEPDAALVEILDRAAKYRIEARDEAVRAWVREHRIALSLPVGTRVRVRWGDHMIEGAIDNLYPHDATYSVSQPGEHGKEVPAEDVTPIDRAAG
jgi:NOL1/NOP2/fmu family ribosome biogenesis protein